MSGARTVRGAVRRAVHAGDVHPWQGYLTLALARAHYRNSDSERRDFDAAVERLWQLCRDLVREHSRS